MAEEGLRKTSNKQVWVDLYSGTPQHIRSIFDLRWNKIPLICTWPDGGEQLATPPQSLNRMIEMARTTYLLIADC